MATASSLSSSTSQDDSQRNLIVNYLPSSLTPEAFRALFSQYGVIESCKIVLDKATGTSQGYGFVKYASDASANQAISAMNGHTVENKILKVSLARPNSAPVQQANVYVANLPKHYTKNDLEQMFLPYGSLVETKILIEPTSGVSKGVGFVRFASKDQAQVAIEALNNQVPLGADDAIVVRFSDTREDKARKGKVVGNPAGFGGGRFRFNPMAAAPPAAAYGGQYPMYQQPPPPPQVATMPVVQPMPAAAYGVYQQPTVVYSLFVYNLPPDADEGLLYRLFAPFGAISDVKIMREPTTNRCKGYAFVHVGKLEDAQQAIISMNGFQVGNKFLQVSFKKDKLK